MSLKLQQTVLSNTVILTEINAAIQLSIEGYCAFRDRYAAFRKLPHSRKLYHVLCEQNFLFSVIFKGVRSRSNRQIIKKRIAWLACLHRTPTSNTRLVIKKTMRISVRMQTTY